MLLVTAVSTSYRFGGIAGVVLLAVLLVALLNRMVKRRGQILAQPGVTPQAVAPAAIADPNSVAPPGWAATPAAPPAPAAGRAPRNPLRSKQITDGIATLIVLALLVLGVVNIAHGSGSTRSSVRGTAPVPAAPASPAPASPAAAASAPAT